MTPRLDEAAFAAWLNGYKAAWEERDPARAAALFTPDAVYHEMPFDAPIEGREAIAAYWVKVTAGQQDVRFSYEVLAVGGREGLCHWHCALTGNPGGERIELDGIFRCRFADQGLVDHFQEWWHIRILPPG
ncbi:MAG TPA: nuclear transport factor 2 family protein [Allosphingosinicella sp.]|nr:nuclear transport factor 2 family protein [Allosphingosinicella sp.]